MHFSGKFDPSGTILWTTQLGTIEWEESTDLSIDGSGNIYITGFTDGDLAGPNMGVSDAFISKYDSSGVQLWIEQFGTDSSDQSLGISADSSGNAFVVGYTVGVLGVSSAGSGDVFVSKFNPLGGQEWTKQLGSIGYDQAYGVTVDDWGNVYFTGDTRNSLGGPFLGGAYDAFVGKIRDIVVPESSAAILTTTIVLISAVSRCFQNAICKSVKLRG